jgi:tRNA modification GTPase
LETEGLADLLNAETEEQRVQSLHQYCGESSKILEKWRTDLIRCLAFAEAYIDFEEDEEDVQADVYDKSAEMIKKLIKEIKTHLEDKNKGEILREGFRVSILVSNYCCCCFVRASVTHKGTTQRW